MTNSPISTEIIKEINKVLNTDDYFNFPATKNRLIDIRGKLEKGDLLSDNDFETLRMNRIFQ